MLRWDGSLQRIGLLLLLVATGAYLWWNIAMVDDGEEPAALRRDTFIPLSMAVTQPIPKNIQFDTAKVDLGRELFNDVRLSVDDTISCASCHVLSKGGADGMVHSIGVNGGEGGINAPTVLNSAFNFTQFWDGRAANLEDQMDGPVNHPKEMGSSWSKILAKLHDDKHYLEAFSKVYPDGFMVANIKDAIATYERSLITPNSRFDSYLRGDQQAISEQEEIGFKTFQLYGCSTCHQGVNLGGNMYERMGLMDDYFGDRGNITEADYGRYNITHKESDRYYFRVPSLRNVARTAPYFHDGRTARLRDAVEIMAKYQLGREIPRADADAIVAFLHTLDGEYEGSEP
ncbi:MAG: cytochrome-c peroxidase [Gallionella sp.]